MFQEANKLPAFGEFVVFTIYIPFCFQGQLPNFWMESTSLFMGHFVSITELMMEVVYHQHKCFSEKNLVELCWWWSFGFSVLVEKSLTNS